MKTPQGRSDQLLESWTKATARPAPRFDPDPARRSRPTWAPLALVVVIAVASIVAALTVGGFIRLPSDERLPTDPAALATSAVEAIGTAPGVRYSLALAVHFTDGTARTNSVGEIDYQRGRFSGTADGGGGAASMFLFGGPSSGAVVIADGVFVKTEAGPWERQPDASPPAGGPVMDRLLDRVGFSGAIKQMLEASVIDPTVRTEQCGSATCQVIGFSPSRQATFDFVNYVAGGTASELPRDLEPVVVDLFVDVSSGFPVRMETRATAGATTTDLTLDVERLDPAPTISPPVP